MGVYAKSLNRGQRRTKQEVEGWKLCVIAYLMIVSREIDITHIEMGGERYELVAAIATPGPLALVEEPNVHVLLLQ